ncbi:MAG TPA: 3-hydroxyacyl-CoA dehydrogenase NAD-binding domain-containing protein [Bacillota bacterium]|nr:3-hydroxyacyl-CoA dehydrogenase NAD-binding domain-containing protein [Bacillota bacterium]
MKYQVKRAAVIGSGVMGSGIAAHLANNGIPTLMLDVVPKELTEKEEKSGLQLTDKVVRNRNAQRSKDALKKQKPSPITTKDSLSLIEVGNLEDDVDKLGDVDWIIEVVVERLDVKKQVLATIDEHRKEGTIVSSNTSGISVEDMVEEVSDDLKAHFLGTHFFNPPRYLHLLEVIPTSHTKDDVKEFMETFVSDVLGKGVVAAKDTPNFIANRIGTYGLLVSVREMLNQHLTIGEIDSITGTMIGRPKSATFRTLDVVGLDTFIDVANNVYNKVEGAEKEAFEVPTFMQEMVEKKMFGAKSGKGFYKKVKGQEGSVIYQLNPETMEYDEKQDKLRTKATEMVSQVKGSANKMKTLYYTEKDPAGVFIHTMLTDVLLYTAEIAYDIAEDIVSIDNAMKWGFGWKQGPFEIWDTLGLEKSVETMKQAGNKIPSWMEDMIEEGNDAFYKEVDGVPSFYHHGKYEPIPVDEKNIDVARLTKEQKPMKSNNSSTLIDMGDGVALLDFHAPNNVIGLDFMQMVDEAIEKVNNSDFVGLIIGSKGRNFCLGANLALMLMEAQDDNFFELEMVVRRFQQTTLNIKYSEKPVVVAPYQMTLGGGAEISLPAASIQASSETYMGLVEFGVGLIPGGGGTKELYQKQLRNIPRDVKVNLLDVANDVFEKVAMAKVSTSADEARENGYLDRNDRISVHPDHQLYDAKQQVLALHTAGYKPLAKEKIQVVGNAGYAAMKLGAKGLAYGNYVSDHDVKIAEKLAYVLSGGRVQEGTWIDEQVMLDLEREAFLSLIGEPLTQARMQHMLLKGKPLRN